MVNQNCGGNFRVNWGWNDGEGIDRYQGIKVSEFKGIIFNKK